LSYVSNEGGLTFNKNVVNRRDKTLPYIVVNSKQHAFALRATRKLNSRSVSRDRVDEWHDH
jgi:hypothetical protein